MSRERPLTSRERRAYVSRERPLISRERRAYVSRERPLTSRERRAGRVADGVEGPPRTADQDQLRAAAAAIKFGTSECRAQIIWFSSGLQSAERKSFGSVRDFRAQIANHLIKFGTSERRAQII